MNSGQSGDKKSYRVILLLVVGLAAFSSAIKELNQMREFTRDARSLVASLSKSLEPSPAVDRVEIPRTAARLEVCENSHPVNAAEPLPPVQEGGVVVAQEPVEVKQAAPTVVTVRPARRDVQSQTVRKLRAVDIDLVELRNQARRAGDLKVPMMADGDDDKAETPVPPNVNLQLPRIIELRQFKVGTKAHDIFLKSLNRSFNVRSAG